MVDLITSSLGIYLLFNGYLNAVLSFRGGMFCCLVIIIND